MGRGHGDGTRSPDGGSSTATTGQSPPSKGTRQVTTTVRRAVGGAFLGLAWGAALRAWMVVLALEFGDRPQFTWHGTFGAVLLPAALTGALLGVAATAGRPSETARWRLIIFSPLLLVVGPVITTESFIERLATTGEGSGAIGVALIGMLGGWAGSGLGAAWLRWIAGLLASLFTAGAALGFYFGGSAADVTPGRVFGALLFTLLMALLAAGIAVPIRYRSARRVSPSPAPTSVTGTETWPAPTASTSPR